MSASVAGPAWDLSAEYQSVDDEQIGADLTALDTLLDQVRELNPLLSEATPDDEAVAAAQQIARHQEAAGKLLSNVSTFANCILSVDSQHEGAQKLNGSLQQYRKRFGDLFEPLSQFIDDASDAVIDAYLSDPQVAPSAFMVHHGRERRHENLSLAEESLVNGLSQDGIHAWGNLYDQLSGTLECEVLVGNEVEKMGVAQANSLLMSEDDSQRRAAWTAIRSAK